ncbi:hypothetical protein DENSPDRAFT_798367 [Dentipellis sp. KUC8613]|nr:hypothetical protein DENSPDRAFT_798367 [Dentipellis sp. KUC8613]
MSEASSSTPSSLTPQSTGTQDSSPNAPASTTKKRRAAFYPNINGTNKPQKPFSRSAAKRESVMALGSIEHLQHYFTKTGIAAKKESNARRKGLVPAIGGLNAHTKASPSLVSLPEFELPPSPAIPAVDRPAFPPYVKTYEVDPENLKPGVIEDLTAVEHTWGLRAGSETDTPPHDPGLLGVDDATKGKGHAEFDVLNLLKTTTRAIRSVRNYQVSLPDETLESHRQQFRPKSLSTSSYTPKRQALRRDISAEPHTSIRRSALEVLTALRALEESARIPLSDDAYDAQSDHGSNSNPGSHSRVASPTNLSDADGDGDPDTSFAFSVVQVQGRRDSVLVWEDEETEFKQGDEEEHEIRERWDERLVLGSGWLYKQDVTLASLTKEQEVVGRYLDIVDEVLFGGAKDGKRGWERSWEEIARRERMEREIRMKGRRVSAPALDLDEDKPSSRPGRGARRIMSTSILYDLHELSVSDEPEGMQPVGEEDEENVDVDDDDLPEWAKRSSFADDPLGRGHALLVVLLPAEFLVQLPRTLDRTAILSALSSGQLLCVAYNLGIRRSRKPWGFIANDAIHDIIALEAQAANGEKDGEKSRTGWTFRRTDNLRLWAAALKLRYMLPIVGPTQTSNNLKPSSADTTPLTSPSPSLIKFPTTNTEPPIHFDARTVARKDDGWEEMLERMFLRWVQAVVDEKRGQP